MKIYFFIIIIIIVTILFKYHQTPSKLKSNKNELLNKIK